VAHDTRCEILRLVLILAIIVFGMVIGALAQILLGGKNLRTVDWGLALVAGLVGSFVGGLLISLLSGDGLELRPSGIIGSLVGAVLVTAGWIWFEKRSAV
jgi:uncharacterized membrane protein YeaQ/YmgE (transglycosylase-associated protein family)